MNMVSYAVEAVENLFTILNGEDKRDVTYIMIIENWNLKFSSLSDDLCCSPSKLYKQKVMKHYNQ